jgi:hypothetical protein
MHAERDCIRTVVLPELSERLAELGIAVELVDLRWGVDTSEEADAQTKQLKVLRICLDEIERSQPFFVALLGDRYGWMPPPHFVGAVEPRLSEREASSITALEIQHGLLDRLAAGGAVRAFVYQRASLPYDRMPAAEAARYSDQEAGNHSGAARIGELKAYLRTLLPDRWREYPAEWDAARGRVGGLDAFARILADDLASEIILHSRQGQDIPPVHPVTAFFARLDETVLGRDDVVRELSGMASVAPGIALIGPRGSGKSAVLARLVHALQDHPLLLVNAAAAAPETARVTPVLAQWCLQLGRRLGVEVQTPDDDEAQDLLFADLLRQAALLSPILIVMDGIDEMEDTARSRYFAWVPERLPEAVRFVVSAASVQSARLLGLRVSLRMLQLAPITRPDAHAIISAICARHRRTLSQRVAATLLAHSRKDGQPAWTNPLWLVTAAEQLNDLDAEDFLASDARGGDGEAQLIGMLDDLAGSLPSELPALFEAVLGRAERRFGKASLAACCALLATARAGLRASDLDHLMPRLGIADWSPLAFAQIRRALVAHLRCDDVDGRWSFNRSDFRQAVLRRYVGGGGYSATMLHDCVSGHLDGLSAGDPVKPTSAFHALRSGRGERISALVLRLMRFRQGNQSWSEVARAFVDADCDLESRVRLTGVILASARFVREVRPGVTTNRYNLLSGLVHHFDVAIREDVSVAMRAAWVCGCADVLRRIGLPDDQLLGSCWSRLASVGLRLSDRQGAAEAAERGLAIFDRFVGARPTMAEGAALHVVGGELAVGSDDDPSLADDLSHGPRAAILRDMPGMFEAHRYRVVLLRTQARALMEMERLESAMAAIDRAGAIADMLDERLSPRFAATVMLLRGEILAGMAKPAEAVTAFRAAMEIVAGLAASGDYAESETLGNRRLARAELLGHGAEASGRLALALAALGRPKEALEQACAAMAAADDIVDLVPSYRQGLFLAARTRQWLAELAGPADGPANRDGVFDGLLKGAARRFSWLAESDPSDALVVGALDRLLRPSHPLPALSIARIDAAVRQELDRAWGQGQ